MQSDIYRELKGRQQDRTLKNVGLVLIVVAFIGFGFCIAYGIEIGNADLLASIGR